MSDVHPMHPGSPDWQSLADAGRVPTANTDPDWACSRCGRDFALSTLTPFLGDSGLVTRFCGVCTAKLREEGK